jgi:hypothetical protein
MGTVTRTVIILVLSAVVAGCRAEQPAPPKKAAPVVVVKPKHPVLTAEQRSELRFPPELISQLELAAGAEAEPFYSTVVVRSENLKGEQGFESRKLVGFSVRTKKADELIDAYRAGLRPKGFLLFKSHQGIGQLPDIATVIRGTSSYDILTIKGTEGQNYHLDTKAIIAWLKAQQQAGSFVVSGAGSDWVETRFIKPPQNMGAQAARVAAFAPDVLLHGPGTVDKLAERMAKMNGFLLLWD